MIDWDKVWSRQMTNFGASFDTLGIRPNVYDAFPSFTQQFEGKLNFMYLDNAEPPGPYVTTGIGDLIDPISSALDLSWVHKSDGSPASQSEIMAEWNMVKSRTDLAREGGKVFGSITTLKLNDDAINNLVNGKMLQNEHILIQRYPNLADWPADAQLGLMSMSWALGPAFNFPKFKAGTDKLDFNAADKESEYKGVGSAPRIAANHHLFQNAAYVITNNLDRNKLWYPGSPSGSGGGGTIPGLGKTASVLFPILAISGLGILAYTNRDMIANFSKRLDRKVLA